VTKEKIEILEKVFFATGSARIQRKSFNLLDQVSSILKAHKELAKVRVEGHTDSQGNDASNLKLSQRRADSVVKYLVKAGVDEARLIGEGFGETAPVADNSTREGRDANRRVEFVIVGNETGEIDSGNDGSTLADDVDDGL
jgi:outer membrane protein OmpA-like peptidoglycan-associated protein